MVNMSYYCCMPRRLSQVKKPFEEVKYFHEMLNQERCGNAKKYKHYLKSMFSLYIGYVLGHFLGLLLF